MGELTKERLGELKSERDRLLIKNAGTFPAAMELACKAIKTIDELLALRTLRDAGDKEVEQMKGMIRKCIYGIPDSEGKIARNMLDKIVDIAITRGQQLREAREEIERLKGDNAALLKQWNDLDVRNEKRHHEWTDKMLTLTAERDTARQELAALKSCPAMAEVDALVAKWNEPGPWESEVVSEALREYETLTRRSISSREEVVGLLKWLIEQVDLAGGIDVKVVENMQMAIDHPEVDDADKFFARRIIEIVEGK